MSGYLLLSAPINVPTIAASRWEPHPGIFFQGSLIIGSVLEE